MTLYEQLGIEQTATSDEIKRAYFRLVRQFSPEKNPDEFMRIRKAFEELSDRDARKAYDATLYDLIDIPGEAKSAIMEAERLAGKGLNSDAINLLEKSLGMYSEDSVASNALQYALGLVYYGIGKIGKAVSIAEKLVRNDPANTKYLRFAAVACEERGWTNRSYAYLTDLMRLDPGNEDSTIAAIAEMDHHPSVLGEVVENIEKNGGKAPTVCMYILGMCFRLSVEPDFFPEYEQMDLFQDMAPKKQPWDDIVFAADKLVEHTTDIPNDKVTDLLTLFNISILHGMYFAERYDVLPQIDRVIENIGAEEIRETSGYKIASVAYAALEAVRAGIPKMLAAYSVMRVFSGAEACDEDERSEYRIEVIAYELDILINYHALKPHIKRFKIGFEALYCHAADFLEPIQRYNEYKMHDECNRRYSRLKRQNSRLSLDWLGEDDDFSEVGVSDEAQPARSEPVRVTKIGRNEPCPCGSGLKYKKCCGK